MVSHHNNDSDFQTTAIINHMDNNFNRSYSKNSETNSFDKPRPTTVLILITIICYVIGIIGNSAALICLKKSDANKRNKYTLLLRFLAANNLMGLCGMLLQLILTKYISDIIETEFRWYVCIGRVIWRYFGLSSGCIACVMAIERWLSLAKPFVYQKHVTYSIIVRTIFLVCFMAAIITFLPLFGVGIYYNEITNQCVRYRYANEFKDIFYAYAFLLFGLCLCISIVILNFFVIRVLYYLTITRKRNDTILWKTNSFIKNVLINTAPASIADEIRFAKMMALLSITFVICWMPQMITIILARLPASYDPKRWLWFSKLADMLMALHFTLDPYVYVLLRHKRFKSKPQSYITNYNNNKQNKNNDDDDHNMDNCINALHFKKFKGINNLKSSNKLTIMPLTHNITVDENNNNNNTNHNNNHHNNENNKCNRKVILNKKLYSSDEDNCNYK